MQHLGRKTRHKLDELANGSLAQALPDCEVKVYLAGYQGIVYKAFVTDQAGM